LLEAEAANAIAMLQAYTADMAAQEAMADPGDAPGDEAGDVPGDERRWHDNDQDEYEPWEETTPDSKPGEIVVDLVLDRPAKKWKSDAECARDRERLENFRRTGRWGHPDRGKGKRAGGGKGSDHGCGKGSRAKGSQAKGQGSDRRLTKVGDGGLGVSQGRGSDRAPGKGKGGTQGRKPSMQPPLPRTPPNQHLGQLLGHLFCLLFFRHGPK